MRLGSLDFELSRVSSVQVAILGPQRWSFLLSNNKSNIQQQRRVSRLR